MKTKLVLLLLPLILSGCAGIQSTTETFDSSGKKLTRTKVMCATMFDGNSALTKLRVTPGQMGNGSNVWSYPGGTSVGSLDQSSTSSNIVTIAGDAASLSKLFIK